jgi:iron complex outermembrane receptor protein
MAVKGLLIGSASIVALMACGVQAAYAQDAAPQSTAGSDQEVVVVGIRQSLEKAIQLKKQNDDQIDAISAEDIGKLPDRNVADALQRLPGVNTQSAASGEGGFDENDRVSIRGTSPSLTQVTVDGHSIATGDWFLLDQFQTVGRSVSFDLLPSEIVQSVEVYKTQDASLLEGGVAGSIDLQTRAPLDLKKQFTFEASAEAAYNSLSENAKPQVSGLIGWHNLDDTLGVVAQGFYEDRTLRRYGQETLGYTTITGAMPIGAANPSLVGVQAPNLIGSTLFEQERKREGVDGAIQWRPSDRMELKLTGFYSKLDADNFNSNYLYWGSNELNNNVPTSYTVKNNTLVAATWPLHNASGAVVDGIIDDNIDRAGAYSDSYYVNLDGKYRVNAQLTIKAQVGYTEGKGVTPSQPFYEVDGPVAVSYAPSGNGWAVTTPGFNPASPTGLSNDFAINETFTALDKELYGKVDGDFAWNNGVFKDVLFGFRGADHTRQVDGYDRGCTLGADGQCYTPGLQPFSSINPTLYPSGYSASALGIPGLLIPLVGNANSIASIVNNIQNPFRGNLGHTVQPANYYWPGSFKVTERDLSAYLMAKVGGEGWRGNFGVRVVDTQQDAYVNVSDPSGTNPADITTSAYGPYVRTDVAQHYTDVLPSLNLTFDLKTDLFLRVSAAETLSRPDFSALGGTVSLTDTNLTGSGGNPNLKPVKAAVYDAALEWYYGPSSIATVSLFYDDLSSYVSYGVSPGTYYSQFYGKDETYQISSPINTSGQVRGVEFQLQQPLPYHFGFQFNGTYADGSESSGAPLVGTSKFTMNAVAYYEAKWLSARLAYTYRSHFFVGLDRSSAENQDDYGSLDASVNVPVTDNITLSFDGLNLTDSLLKYYAENTTQPRAVYENGVRLFAGVRIKY